MDITKEDKLNFFGAYDSNKGNNSQFMTFNSQNSSEVSKEEDTKGWKSVFEFIFKNNTKAFHQKISQFNQAKTMNMVNRIGGVEDHPLLKGLKNLTKKRRSRAVIQVKKKSIHSNGIDGSSLNQTITSRTKSVIEGNKRKSIYHNHKPHRFLNSAMGSEPEEYLSHRRTMQNNKLSNMVNQGSFQFRKSPPNLLKKDSSLEHTSNMPFRISVMRANTNETESRRSHTFDSVVEPSIMLPGSNCPEIIRKAKGSSVIPRYSQYIKAESYENVSNKSFSSTSSKVTKNSGFLDCMRFSLRDCDKYDIKYYNRQKSFKIVKKRKSKSQVNLTKFSKNLKKCSQQKKKAKNIKKSNSVYHSVNSRMSKRKKKKLDLLSQRRKLTKRSHSKSRYLDPKEENKSQRSQISATDSKISKQSKKIRKIQPLILNKKNIRLNTNHPQVEIGKLSSTPEKPLIFTSSPLSQPRKRNNENPQDVPNSPPTPISISPSENMVFNFRDTGGAPIINREKNLQKSNLSTIKSITNQDDKTDTKGKNTKTDLDTILEPGIESGIGSKLKKASLVYETSRSRALKRRTAKKKSSIMTKRRVFSRGEKKDKFILPPNLVNITINNTIMTRNIDPERRITRDCRSIEPMLSSVNRKPRRKGTSTIRRAPKNQNIGSKLRIDDGTPLNSFFYNIDPK